MTIAIIDYGMGNLHSVAKALEHVGAQNIQITNDITTILNADKVILPGVGAIGDCMAQIKALNLIPTILKVSASKPFLGICVGMQALFNFSAESSNTKCLGLLDGDVKHLSNITQNMPNNNNLKIPHMGWNKVKQTRNHPLWHGITSGEYFYFVHSYAVADIKNYTFGTCNYGADFTCAVGRNYIFAVQFHPEKSHHAGLKLLQNFINWNGNL